MQFPGYGLLDDQFVITGNKGLDGTSLFWWRVYHREVPDAEKRKLQCPGYRGGTEGKYIDLSLEALDLFLVAYAKPVLFINNEQAEPLKMNILG